MPTVGDGSRRFCVTFPGFAATWRRNIAARPTLCNGSGSPINCKLPNATSTTSPQGLTAAGKLDQLGGVEHIRAHADKMIGRIDGATQGYSGFFDFVKVDEAVLDQVYQFDVSLMQNVEAVSDAIDALDADADDAAIKAGIKTVLAKLDELEDAWDKRENILKGLG